MTRENVLDKVRKLLNMTTENGCTESEAAIAVGQAQKLMLKHNLEAIDLDSYEEEDEEQIERWDDPLDVMPNSTRQSWRGQLAMTLCSHNGCTTFWNWQNRSRVLTIVGRASDAAATRYMHQFCVRETERMAKRYKGNGRTWLNNWRQGVVVGIRKSLKEAREAIRQEYAAETGTALVAVDKSLAVIDQRTRDASRYASQHCGLRSGRTSQSKYDYGAHATGKRDGRTIDVNGQSGKRLSNAAKRVGGD